MQVEFNLLEAEAQFGVSMDGLTVETFELSPGTAMDDFYLVLGHSGRRIAGRLEYNAELFTEASARRFAADWQVRFMTGSCCRTSVIHQSLAVATDERACCIAAQQHGLYLCWMLECHTAHHNHRHCLRLRVN